MKSVTVQNLKQVGQRAKVATLTAFAAFTLFGAGKLAAQTPDYTGVGKVETYIGATQNGGAARKAGFSAEVKVDSTNAASILFGGQSRFSPTSGDIVADVQTLTVKIATPKPIASLGTGDVVPFGKDAWTVSSNTNGTLVLKVTKGANSATLTLKDGQPLAAPDNAYMVGLSGSTITLTRSNMNATLSAGQSISLPASVMPGTVSYEQLVNSAKQYTFSITPLYLAAFEVAQSDTAANPGTDTLRNRAYLVMQTTDTLLNVITPSNTWYATDKIIYDLASGRGFARPAQSLVYYETKRGTANIGPLDSNGSAYRTVYTASMPDLIHFMVGGARPDSLTPSSDVSVDINATLSADSSHYTINRTITARGMTGGFGSYNGLYIDERGTRFSVTDSAHATITYGYDASKLRFGVSVDTVSTQPTTTGVPLAGAEATGTLVVYPNPAFNGLAFVKVEGQGPLTVTVSDALGNEVARPVDGQAYPAGQVAISTRGLSAGTYFVQVTQGAQVRTAKLVIE